jgi:U3 small nucleolar RNA-associated protein 15
MDDTVRSISYRSDGRLVAVSGVSGDILVMDIVSRTLLRTLKGHKAPVRGVKFLSDKVHLVSVSDDRTIRLWDIASGGEVWCANVNGDFVRACAVSSSSDSKLFVTGSYDHTLMLWSTDTNTPLLTMDHKSPIEAIALLPDNATVVSAGQCSLKFWDISDGGRFVREVIVHHKTISRLAVSTDGKYLLTGSLDRSLKIICLEDMSVAHQLKFPAAIMSISLSSDSKRIAAGLSNGRVVVLSFMGGRETISSKEKPAKSNIQQTSLALESHRVTKDSDILLKRFDRLLKSFRYYDALEAVIKQNNGALLSTAIRELTHRNGLVPALSGRTEADLVPILELLVRFVANPRFAATLIEAGFVILDIYGAVIGKSTEFDSALKRLRAAINLQIEIQRGLMHLEGSLQLLTTNSRAGTALRTL